MCVVPRPSIPYYRMEHTFVQLTATNTQVNHSVYVNAAQWQKTLLHMSNGLIHVE